MQYRCQISSLPVFSKIKIEIVHNAAKVSLTSIVTFLFHLSLSEPAKILIITYGAYEQTDNKAVVNAEPLTVYDHTISA